MVVGGVVNVQTGNRANFGLRRMSFQNDCFWWMLHVVLSEYSIIKHLLMTEDFLLRSVFVVAVVVSFFGGWEGEGVVAFQSSFINTPILVPFMSTTDKYHLNTK